MSLENNIDRLIAQEPAVEERERLWIPRDVDVITISGHPGTGKTVVGQQLAEMYGMEYVKIGDLFREFVRESTGQEVVGYTERSEDMDRMLDEKQRLIMKNARLLGRKIILEGRLAGIIATEEQQRARTEHESISRIQRILFTADNDERIRRVLNRYPTYSESEARKLTTEREQKDLQTWQQLHPIIQGLNDIYDPTLENSSGQPLFADLIVDTTAKNITQVRDTVHEWLVEHGFVEKAPPTHLEPAGIIFAK